MTQSVASTDISNKPRRFQFGLRAMFAITTIFAIIFSFYYYYLAFRFKVTDRSFLIDAESVRMLLAKNSAVVVREKDSTNFSRLALTDEQYEKFLNDNPNCCINNISGVGTARIGGTEIEFESSTTSGQFTLNEKGTTQVSRVSHRKFTLRLSLDASHGNPNSLDKTFIGRLKYDGPIPEGHLIFVAPVNDYYIVFDYQVTAD